MSLVNLTFGNSTSITNSNGTELIEVSHAADAGTPTITGERGKVKIGRVTEFFGRPEICILGELMEGVIATNMMAVINDKRVEVAELEHKYGTRALNRPGTKITLMLVGLKKYDIKQNDVVEFWPATPKVSNKPKGKLIIC
ncbi:MAG: hypothetical protein Q7S92_03720 [Candidatus Diapherotrites archaeon]|nr:hypothetical protein [Candidatus Diapherotrites archaeon]